MVDEVGETAVLAAAQPPADQPEHQQHGDQRADHDVDVQPVGGNKETGEQRQRHQQRLSPVIDPGRPIPDRDGGRFVMILDGHRWSQGGERQGGVAGRPVTVWAASPGEGLAAPHGRRFR